MGYLMTTTIKAINKSILVELPENMIGSEVEISILPKTLKKLNKFNFKPLKVNGHNVASHFIMDYRQ